MVGFFYQIDLLFGNAGLVCAHGHLAGNEAVCLAVDEKDGKSVLFHCVDGRKFVKGKSRNDAAHKSHDVIEGEFGHLEPDLHNVGDDLSGRSESAVCDYPAHVFGKLKSCGAEHRRASHRNSVKEYRLFGIKLAELVAPIKTVVALLYAEGDVFTLAFAVSALMGQEQGVAERIVVFVDHAEVTERYRAVSVEKRDDALSVGAVDKIGAELQSVAGGDLNALGFLLKRPFKAAFKAVGVFGDLLFTGGKHLVVGRAVLFCLAGKIEKIKTEKTEYEDYYGCYYQKNCHIVSFNTGDKMRRTLVRRFDLIR